MSDEQLKFTLYTPQQLLAIRQDPRASVSTRPWRSFFNARTVLSEQQHIAMAELFTSRRVAPFMRANAPGRPIFREDGAVVRTFAPAYTKPKDPVTPQEAMAKTMPELLGMVGLQTPQSRFDTKVAQIMEFHDKAIERLIDWMYATSLKNSYVDVAEELENGRYGPSRRISFGRDADHTITDSNRYWDQTNFSIREDIQKTVRMVGNAHFGGVVTNMIMGADAADILTQSSEIKELMNNNFRGSDEILVRRGIIREDPLNPFTYLGRLEANLECWMVSGPGNQFENADGTKTDIIETNEVLYTSPSAEAVEAYGAIMEANALMAIPKFVKMWPNEDPSATFIMTQSAPLTVVLSPNATAIQQIKA